MRFGSLFSGIGGLDLGLERAGMGCVWMVENDDYCQRVLAKHWPDVPKYKDVRDVGKQNIEPVDLIAGGFPCQPHSVAGKRKGAADDRNLWPEFIRIIRETRPRYVLAENVPGIITTYLDTVLSDLESEDYAYWTFNIPACAFDAPHRRERIFIVAYTASERCGEERTDRSRSEKRIACSGAASEDVADTELSSPSRLRNDSRETIPSVESIRPIQSSERVAEGQGELGWTSHWTVEPAMGELVDGVSDRLVRFRGRVATGIPNRVNKLRGLGNAVVPVVAQYIGERILEHARL